MRANPQTNGRGPAAGTRVLVVDDEPYITDLVSLSLRYEGFTTREAHNGRDALAAATEFDPALVVLDIMLPDLDGLEVTRRLRAGGRQMPVLFLTARDATEDKVAGLTVGGDDYVTKPFSLEELVARIRAILRRTGTDDGNAPLAYADLTLDEDLREVHRAGRLVPLTPTEFNLLRYLMHNPRRVLSKSQIMDHVWDYDFGGDPNVIETYISYLRKKIDRGAPPLIQTVRGVGYCLRLAGD